MKPRKTRPNRRRIIAGSVIAATLSAGGAGAAMATGASLNPWAVDDPGPAAETLASAAFWGAGYTAQDLEALAEARSRPDFVPLAVAFKRVANIQEKAGGAGAAKVDPALLRDEAERRLLADIERVEAEAASSRAGRNYPAVLRNVATLEPAVARFFDDVLVMAEEPAVRANRLGLLRRVAALFADVADFRKIQAELPQAQARAQGEG